MNVTASRALVVLSGGQDSVTCLYWAIQKWGRDHVAALTIDYHQRHQLEINSARRIADMAGVQFNLTRVGRVLRGSSPLVSLGQELERYEDFDSMSATIGDRVEHTFVPMRNALFLTIAANHAEVFGADNLVTGVCQEDNANYPDCRNVFVHQMEILINTALGYDKGDGLQVGERYIQVHAPLVRRTKAQTVRLALTIPGAWDALALTHTAYDGAYPPTGKDHASVLRAHGFEEAGLPDPLVLRAHNEGLMELPDTPNYSEAAQSEAWVRRVPYDQIP